MKKVPIEKVYSVLKKEVQKYTVPVVDLIKIKTHDPVKVLIATILSARTKDEVTVEVCKKLFSKVKKIADLKKFTVRQIEKLIYPVGFYRNKAKMLKKLPLVLEEKFKGVIPSTVEELVELPGVGRKTANLVVAVGFGKPAVCIDVHCHRIFNRLGYIKSNTPFETEMKIRKKLPIKYWEKINSVLVAFGQNLCRPVSPYCSRCSVVKYCNKVGVKTTR